MLFLVYCSSPTVSNKKETVMDSFFQIYPAEVYASTPAMFAVLLISAICLLLLIFQVVTEKFEVIPSAFGIPGLMGSAGFIYLYMTIFPKEIYVPVLAASIQELIVTTLLFLPFLLLTLFLQRRKRLAS